MSKVGRVFSERIVFRKIKSLQSRLTLIALFFIIAASVAMGAVGIRLTINFETSRYHENFKLLATYMARNAELGVILSNEKMLEVLADNMVAIADVQGVVLRLPDGKVLVQKGKIHADSSLEFVTVPIMSDRFSSDDSPFLRKSPDKEIIGEIILSFSRASLLQLTKLMVSQYLFVSLLLASIAVVMYWIIARSVHSPMLEILEVARAVTRGRLDVRASEGSLQETNTLASALNEMLDALEEQRGKLEQVHTDMAKQQALAEVGKFSMIVAHEIKNPLAIIKGSLDIFKKPETPADLKEKMVHFIEDEVVRINLLIEEFLLYARPREPQLCKLDVGVFFASISLRSKFMQGDGELEFSHSPIIPCYILGDQHLLERALLNIIGNGLEASGGVGVCIQTECDLRDELFIRITDQGSGVVEENIEKIFEPFFSTKAKGTGLGLAISREIIEAHGGTLTAICLPDIGGCFEVRLPLLKDEQNKPVVTSYERT